MSSSKKMDDLNLTRDEMTRLTEALKKEEFRKLLAEYAEEISDPENRKKYEEEISALEAERGKDVKFIHPEPGYVLKTTSVSGEKIFINVCKSEVVGKPSMVTATQNGKRGMQWSLPHSFAPPRDDYDKSKNSCKVIDVVFHPETYRMAESNNRFKEMIQETAFDGIEKQFKLQIDRKKIKHPKISFKGTPTATVLREDSNKPVPGKIDKDVLQNLPNPYDKRKDYNTETNNAASLIDSVVPTHNVVHSFDMDIQQFQEQSGVVQSQMPNALVVTVDLPKLDSAMGVDLKVFEKSLTLKSEEPARYELNIDLPYAVLEEDGSAKFDKARKCLRIKLPVKKMNTSSTITEHKETISVNDKDID